MFKYLIICFTLFLTFSNFVFAENINLKQSLENKISEINTTTQQQNVNKLVNYLPPHLLSSMSLRLGKTIEQLKQDFKIKLNQQIKTDSNIQYSLTKKDIEYGKTSDGQIYAIIPTITENKENIIHSQILALYENNNWYIIYGGVKAAQNPLLSLIYPSISEIHFKANKIIKK